MSTTQKIVTHFVGSDRLFSSFFARIQQPTKTNILTDTEGKPGLAELALTQLNGFHMIYLIASIVLIPSLLLVLCLCRMAAIFGTAEDACSLSESGSVVHLQRHTGIKRDQAA